MKTRQSFGPTAPPLRKGTSLWLLAVLSLLMAFSSISTDLYLPAMPRMADFFGVEHGRISFTIASYLGGFTVGQLVWGPIGDAFGRKKPIITGLALFAAASVGCALSLSATHLIVWRLVQGFGASAGVVLARAMVRDLYSGDQAARMLSTLLAIMALSPLIGPVIGASLLHIADWQVLFWILAAVGGVAICAVATLRESWQPAERETRKPVLLARYAPIAKHKEVWTFGGAGACYYFGLFAFIAASPAVFIDYYGFSPDLFAWLLAGGTAAIIAANLVNVRLIDRIGYRTALKAGTAVAAAAGGGGVIFGTLPAQDVFGLVAALFVFMAMAGLVVGNSIAGALDACPSHAGAASAFVGSLQYAGGMAGSSCVALLADGTAGPMVLALFASGLGAFAFASFAPPKPLE